MFFRSKISLSQTQLNIKRLIIHRDEWPLTEKIDRSSGPHQRWLDKLLHHYAYPKERI